MTILFSQVAFLCINMLDERTSFMFGARTSPAHKGHHYQMYMANTMMQEIKQKYPALEWNLGTSVGSSSSDRFRARTDIVAIVTKWVRIE